MTLARRWWKRLRGRYTDPARDERSHELRHAVANLQNRVSCATAVAQASMDSAEAELRAMRLAMGGDGGSGGGHRGDGGGGGGDGGNAL